MRYHDGERERYGDSAHIERALYMALGADFTATLDAAEKGNAEAVGAVCDACRLAFEMRPFDLATGEGATEPECFAALAALWASISADNEVKPRTAATA